jgi:hypothetical protein
MFVLYAVQVSFSLSRDAYRCEAYQEFYCHSIDAREFFHSLFYCSWINFQLLVQFMTFRFFFYRILQPQLMGEIISCFTLSRGNELVVLYAASIILCSVVSVLAFQFFSLSILNIGKKISNASCSMLYSKVRESGC